MNSQKKNLYDEKVNYKYINILSTSDKKIYLNYLRFIKQIYNRTHIVLMFNSIFNYNVMRIDK